MYKKVVKTSKKCGSQQWWNRMQHAILIMKGHMDGPCETDVSNVAKTTGIVVLKATAVLEGPDAVVITLASVNNC